jgi:hypothetical protein
MPTPRYLCYAGERLGRSPRTSSSSAALHPLLQGQLTATAVPEDAEREAAQVAAAAAEAAIEAAVRAAGKSSAAAAAAGLTDDAGAMLVEEDSNGEGMQAHGLPLIASHALPCS